MSPLRGDESLSLSSRGGLFQEHFEERRRFIDDMTAEAVTVWHVRQERLKYI